MKKKTGRKGVSKSAPRRSAASTTSSEEDDVIDSEESEIQDLEDEMAADAGNDVDDGDDEAGSGGQKEKKRRGKRQIIYDCCGLVPLHEDDPSQGLKKGDIGIVLDPIPVTMPADDQTTFDVAGGRKEAIALFETKYGKKPTRITGPYYIRKGVAAQTRKRETINVTVAAEAPFINKRGTATHKFKEHEWNVIVNFTEKPDTVYVFYQGLVNPDLAPKDKSKLQKPTPKFLPISALKGLRENPTHASEA